MAYIASDKIGIFPLSKNRTSETPLNSRLFYESNVANIINQVIDTDGFVITNYDDLNAVQYNDNTQTLSLSTPLEFNIGGYYVKIDEESNHFVRIPFEGVSKPEAIYASITLTDDTPTEINGQDDNGVYTGIEFTTNEPTNKTFTLKILERFATSPFGNQHFYRVPQESKIKFDLLSLGITAIDGKH